MTDRNVRTLLVTLALVAIAAVGCTSDEPTATPTPTVEASPTVASTAMPTPTSTPTASATATPEGDREPYHPALSLGEAGRLPDEVSLFVWRGCYACDGAPDVLLRLDAGRDQPVAVWENAGEVAPYVGGARIDGDVLYLFECTVGYCGNVGGSEGQPSAITLLRSTDLGATFESLGEREGRSEDLALWDVEPVRRAPTFNEGHQPGEFLLDGVRLNVRQLDDRGRSPDDGPPYAMRMPTVSEGDLIAAAWAARDASNVEPLLYLTVFRADGMPIATFAGNVQAMAWLDESHLAVTWVPEGVDPMVGVLDIFAGTVHPLAAFEGIPGRNAVLGVIGD